MLKTGIKKIICAISGGVDSAVAAMLLKRKGYEVSGIFMRNWDLTDETGRCTIDQDLEDAHYVCQQMDIPLQEISFVKEYWNQVFVEMLKDYENGLTPNPDILCNRHIKFDALYDHVINKCNADMLATGHYARTSLGENLNGFDTKVGVKLLTATDELKDQTFFLSQIKQLPLQKVLFPLGECHKNIVKKIATESGLEKIARKKESMGICFIGSRNFQSFVEEYIEPKPGNFVNIEDGSVVGKHKGLHYWTLGQRCHIGGHQEAFFAVAKDISTNDINVVQGTNHPALFTTSFICSNPHWINSPVTLPVRCKFRFQHAHPLVDCVLNISMNGNIHVDIDRPTRAITPGQYAVFYNGEECLGSASIIKPGPSLYDLNYKDRVVFAKEFS